MNCLCVFTLILVPALCDFVSIPQQLGKNVLESEKLWQDIGGRSEKTSGDPFFLNHITSNGIINVPQGNYINRHINQKGVNQKSSSLENNLNKNIPVSPQRMGLFKFHHQPGIIKLLKDYFNHIEPTMLGCEPSLASHNLKYLKPPNSFTLGDSSKWSNSDSMKRVKDDSHNIREYWKLILDALVPLTKPVRLRNEISQPQTIFYKEPYSRTSHLKNSVITDLLNIHNVSKIASNHQPSSVDRLSFNKNLSNSLSFKKPDNLINHTEYSNSKNINPGIGGKTILQLSSLLENSLNDKIAHHNTAKSSLASSNGPLNSINLALIAKALSRNSNRGSNIKTNFPEGNRGKSNAKQSNSGFVKLLNTLDVKDSMKSGPSLEKENKNSKISIITSNGASINRVSSPLKAGFKSKANCLDALSARMSEISNMSLFLSSLNKSQISPLTQLNEIADHGSDLEKNRLKLMTENFRRFLGEQNIILNPSEDPIKENNFIDKQNSKCNTRLPSDVSSVLTKKIPSDLTGCMNVCYDSHSNDKQVQESCAMLKANTLKVSSTGSGESTSQGPHFKNSSIHSTKFLNNLIPLLKSSSNLAIRKYSLDSDNIGGRSRVMNLGKSTLRLKPDFDTSSPSILDGIESIKHIPVSNTGNRSKTYDIQLISTTEGKILIVLSERPKECNAHQKASLNKSITTNSSRASEIGLIVDLTTQAFESHGSTRVMKDSKAQFLFETTKGCVMFEKSNKSDVLSNSTTLESVEDISKSIHNNCDFTEICSLESYALTTEIDSSLFLNNGTSKVSPKIETANPNSLQHSNSDVNLKVLESNILSLISNYTEGNERTTSKEDIMLKPVSYGEYFTVNDFKSTINTLGNLDKVTNFNKVRKHNISNLASPNMSNNSSEASCNTSFVANLANFETNSKVKKINSKSQEIPSSRNLLVSNNYFGKESISGENYISSPFNGISNLNALNNGNKFSADKATHQGKDYLNLINMLIPRLQEDNDKNEKRITSKPSFLASFGSDLVPKMLAKETATDKKNNDTSNSSEPMLFASNQSLDPEFNLLEAMRAYVFDNASSANSSFSDSSFESPLSDPQTILKSAILNKINKIETMDNLPSKLQDLPLKNEPKDVFEKTQDNFMCTDPSLNTNFSLVETQELDIVPKNVLDILNDGNVKGIAVVLISLKPTEATTLLKTMDLKNQETEKDLPDTALLGTNTTIVISVSEKTNHVDDANKTEKNVDFKDSNVPVGVKVSEVTLYPIFPLYPVYPFKPILSNFTHNNHEVRS